MRGRGTILNDSQERLTGIKKLDDANDAGRGKKAKECTLILTEGDSAKVRTIHRRTYVTCNTEGSLQALAISGLSVVGRDKFGVFPLRGKLLNVREASTNQVRYKHDLG